MWRIDNRTGYAADRSWIRDADGAEVWIVAVKATYDILPDGSTRLSAQQVPVHSGPVPHPDAKSLRYETDLGPMKAATDVILNGHAYAQTDEPVSELLVGFKLGPVKRAARVLGDRIWQRGLLGVAPGKPAPFARMGLTYERAFGGDDQHARRRSGNPVGCGAASDSTALPNVESIDGPLRRRGDRVAAISFGPVASHWPDRARYAGTYDQAWLQWHYLKK